MNRFLNGADAVAEKLIPVTGRQLSEATITIAALVALTFAGGLLSNALFPIPPVYDVLVLFVPAFIDAVTALVLLNMFRVPTVSRPMFYLALTFAGSAIFGLIVTLGLPGAHGADAIARGPNSLPWLTSLGHFYFASSALVYVVLRRREVGLVRPSGRFVTIVIIANVAAVMLCITAASVLGDRPAPPPALNILVALLAFGSLFRLPNRTLIDVAFTLAMLSMTLGLVLSPLHSAEHSGTWFVDRALYLMTSTFVLVGALRTLSRTRGGIMAMTESIAESRRILERNAARLNGLWYVAAHGIGDDRQRYQALLDTATAALRPGSSTFGYISHQAGDSIVVDSTYASALLPEDSRAAEAIFHPGAVMPLQNTIERHFDGSDRSVAWTDFSQVPVAGMAWEGLGWTRVIGSSLIVGAKRYFIVFGSMHEYIDDPYSEDDFTYVDVLAAFVAGRLLQEVQIERIKFQIEHDALTGLHTRSQFRVAIRKAINLGNPFAVAAVNLDDFRAVNEESGSLVADELLVEVASEIEHVADDDIAARLGADEFGLLLANRQTGQIMQTRLGEYFDLFATSFPTGLTEEARRLSISASIGAASFPEDGRTEQELMQRVNIALASAKAAGGKNVTFFSRSMETIVDQQRHLSTEIRDALARNQFDLEYQPTVSLATGLIYGAEALIRWNHPTRGRLAPDAFIPFSERHGLSIEIGRWVFARALHDIMSLATVPPKFRCYINISAPGLEEEAFVSNVRSDIAQYPGAAERFGIEVTEGTAMLNAERAIIALGALRRLGLKIAIDDFGTGYSSLSYLKRLPIDIIKLDRSFITGLPHEQADVALTDTLLAMASRFRLTTLAEGVETVEQAAWLIDHGCELAQGFLYSKSVPIEELRGLLTAPRSADAA